MSLARNAQRVTALESLRAMNVTAMAGMTARTANAKWTAKNVVEQVKFRVLIVSKEIAAMTIYTDTTIEDLKEDIEEDLDDVRNLNT